MLIGELSNYVSLFSDVFGGCMAHVEQQDMLTNRDHDKPTQIREKSIQQQLTDANKQIEDLKLQLAWLDRPYE
jgi:hypothetical protein